MCPSAILVFKWPCSVIIQQIDRCLNTFKAGSVWWVNWPILGRKNLNKISFFETSKFSLLLLCCILKITKKKSKIVSKNRLFWLSWIIYFFQLPFIFSVFSNVSEIWYFLRRFAYEILCKSIYFNYFADTAFFCLNCWHNIVNCNFRGIL